MCDILPSTLLGVAVALSHVFFRSFLWLLTIIVHRIVVLFLSFWIFNLSFTRIKAAGSFVPGILATRIISLSSWQAFSLDLDSFIGNIHLHSSSSVVDIRQTGIYLFLFFLFSHCLAHALSLFLSFSLSLALAFSLKIPFSRIIWAALDTDILYQ